MERCARCKSKSRFKCNECYKYEKKYVFKNEKNKEISLIWLFILQIMTIGIIISIKLLETRK